MQLILKRSVKIKSLMYCYQNLFMFSDFQAKKNHDNDVIVKR